MSFSSLHVTHNATCVPNLLLEWCNNLLHLSHRYSKHFYQLPCRYHNPEASVEEGLATLKRCVDEVAKRLIVSPGKYKVKIVDKDGIREVEL